MPANGKLGTFLQSDEFNIDQVIGFSAVIAACLTSGFSGVYFEKILKGSKTSLWIRNMQLGKYLSSIESVAYDNIIGLFSMVFSGIGVIVHDWSAISKDGFFQGYSWLVGAVILLQVTVNSVIAVASLYIHYRLLADSWWLL